MKAAVQYSKLPAAVFCSVTPTVQRETQEKKGVLPFFHFTNSYSQKQEKKKLYAVRYMHTFEALDCLNLKDSCTLGRSSVTT